jgi:hypothetical protein
MDKVDAEVERIIQKSYKQYLVGVFAMQYQNLEGESKQQCFEEIKKLLIELYGIVGLSNV